MIRVVLPYHLRNLAQVQGEIALEIDGAVTQGSIIDAIEKKYPTLKGTIRDYQTGRRRPFIRFFACEQDFSNSDPETLLPAEVASGAEPFLVVGAIAGG
jgi:sulfur-carrier protein